MIKKVLTLGLLILSVVLTVASVAAAPAPVSVAQAETEWLTYTDPRFDFTVEYPADWQIIPRDDSDVRAMSGFVTFVVDVPINKESNA